MQKHQEWMENKNYEHHMRCLQSIRIQSRTKFVKSAMPHRSPKRNLHHTKESHLDGTTQMQTSNHKFNNIRDSEFRELQNRKSERSKDGKDFKSTFLTVKERQLLWDNYLLGKRILETNSVISMRKNEADYKKYKKILDARTQRTRKQKINDQFRQQKLHEYALANYRVAQCGRLPTSTASRQIMCLKIKDLKLLKQKYFTFEDLVLKIHVKSGKDQNKKLYQQTSEIISLINLQGYCFFFKLPPHHFRRIKAKQNGQKMYNLIFTLCEVKSLQEHSVGTFIINEGEVSNQISHRVCKFQKKGKELGQIQVDFQCFAKKILAKQFQ